MTDHEDELARSILLKAVITQSMSARCSRRRAGHTVQGQSFLNNTVLAEILGVKRRDLQQAYLIRPISADTGSVFVPESLFQPVERDLHVDTSRGLGARRRQGSRILVGPVHTLM